MKALTAVQIHRLEEKKRRFASFTFLLKMAVVLLFLLVPFCFPSFKSIDLAFKIAHAFGVTLEDVFQYACDGCLTSAGRSVDGRV